jgi:putative N-acetyltransferase (TIGR04045 family)
MSGTRSTARTGVVCSIVDSPADDVHHHRIRAEVFVDEQAVFPGDDLDDRDGEPTTIKVVAFWDETPAGTVRLFPTSSDQTQWQGDRLAVLAPFRRHHVGGPLVDFAVSTAAQRGGQRMTAHIQIPNVRFFETLGWTRSGPIEIYAGLPHQPMAIDVRLRAAIKETIS